MQRNVFRGLFRKHCMHLHHEPRLHRYGQRQYTYVKVHIAMMHAPKLLAVGAVMNGTTQIDDASVLNRPFVMCLATRALRFCASYRVL